MGFLAHSVGEITHALAGLIGYPIPPLFAAICDCNHALTGVGEFAAV